MKVISEATDKTSSPSLGCVVGIVGNGSKFALLDQQPGEKAAIGEYQRKGGSDLVNEIHQLRSQHLGCMGHSFVAPNSKYHYRMAVGTMDRRLM